MAGAPVLRVTQQLAERIGKHGEETYPHECCGALLGREAAEPGGGSVREVVELFPLINRRDDSPRNRFSVAPLDVLEAEKAASRQNLELLGWYHSHPDHPAQPSQYDRDHAWPWYSYVIVSVNSGVAGEMTSWRLGDDRAAFAPEAVEVKQHAAR